VLAAGDDRHGIEPRVGGCDVCEPYARGCGECSGCARGLGGDAWLLDSSRAGEDPDVCVRRAVVWRFTEPQPTLDDVQRVELRDRTGADEVAGVAFEDVVEDKVEACDQPDQRHRDGRGDGE